MFEALQCPYCRTPFTEEKKNSLRHGYGVVYCACDRFPILSGILYCRKDDTLLHRKLITLIEQKKYKRAIWVALSQEQRSHRILTLGAFLLQYQGFQIDRKIFLQILRIVGPSRSWFEYLLRRDSSTMPTAVKVLEPSLPGDGLIVDIGCGWGDLISSLRKLPTHKNTHVIGIDKSMFSLIAAQIFNKDEHVQYVCADVEAGLPIQRHKAGRIILVDCFAWIYDKKRIMEDAHRALKKQGSLDVVNVHVQKPTTLSYGFGISAQTVQEYASDFSKLTFFANDLSPKGQLQRIRKVDDEGYSFEAQK